VIGERVASKQPQESWDIRSNGQKEWCFKDVLFKWTKRMVLWSKLGLGTRFCCASTITEKAEEK